MHRLDETLIRALDAIARLDDAAEVLAEVSRVALVGFGKGVVVDASFLRVRPLVQHVERDRIEVARAACGDAPARRSALVQRAMREQLAVCTHPLDDDDPLERVRAVFGSPMVTVVPMCAGAREVGFFAVFGGPHRGGSLDALRLLGQIAAATLDRIVSQRRARDEVSVRDAAIAMLGALVEDRPFPWLLFDADRRLIGWNPAFEGHRDVRYGAALPDLGLPAPIMAIVDDVLAGGVPSITEVSGTVVAAHRVSADGAVRGCALSLIDVSAARNAEREERVLRQVVERLHAGTSLQAAFDALATIAFETFGEWAVLSPVGRAMHSAGSTSAASYDLASVISRRLSLATVPIALPADEVALLSLEDPRVGEALDALPRTALLGIPFGVCGVSLCVGRRGRDFAPAEVAFAAELGRVAGRALSRIAEHDEVRARAMLLEDFVHVGIGELSNRLTALMTEWFVAERTAMRSLGNVRRAIARLSESLHTLVAAAPKSRPPPREPVDLASIVRPMAADLRAPSLVHIEPVPKVLADAAWVQQALAGVLQYVLGRAGDGVLVCVRVESVGAEVTVTFSGGRGYRHADASSALDALWRGDEDARALTVARAVLAAQGGRTWIETAEGAGAAYSFALPALDEARHLGEQGVAVERLVEARRRAELPRVDATVGGEDQRGNGGERRIAPLRVAEPEAVEIGHDEIENHQRRVEP